MNLLKSKQSPTADSADKGRRSFFLKVGAGVSGALASTAGVAGTETGNAGDLSLQIALLQNEKALRKFHQAFEQAIDDGLNETVIEMFADDARVLFSGGVFDNRNQGVSRLYRHRFPSAKTGRRMEPAPGFELNADQQQDAVEVSSDRLSATAVFPYSIQAGKPLESHTSLASMARLHGEGVQTWWEGGLYHATYRRDAVDSDWKISKLEYNTLSRADYRPGRSYARPISVSPISTRYPDDPHGPDALV